MIHGIIAVGGLYLMDKKKQAFSEYHSLKDGHREMLIHKSNVDSLIGLNARNHAKTNTKKVSKDTEETSL